jgi:hypothetical protein
MAWAALFICSACSTTYLQVPIQRFSTPEVSGAHDLSVRELNLGIRRDDTVEFAAGSDNARTITVKYSQNSDSIEQPLTDTAGVDTPFGVSGGFADRFDYLISLSTLFTPQELELKYQLLGETRRTSGPGNFSLALSLLAGAGPLNYDAHSKDDTNPVTWQLNETLLSEGVIAGYRIAQELLVYGGVFANEVWISVTRNEPNAANLGHVTSTYSARAASTTFNLGAEYTPWVREENAGFFIRGEFAASNFFLEKTVSEFNTLVFGMQVGSKF